MLLRDFIAACKPWGDWHFMDTKYLRTKGVLGIEEYPMDWPYIDEPWWAGIAHVIRRRIVVVAINIGHCLSRKEGWCQWDEDNLFSRPKFLAHGWYTFKAVLCLVLFATLRPKEWKSGRQWVDVGAWGLGLDYWGEAQGHLLQVGRGVFTK